LTSRTRSARAANEEDSQTRQTALEGLARFAGELAAHFQAEESPR